MSTAGYIGKKVTDDLGIIYSGEEEALQVEATKGDEEVYENVADYDPVLRAHCRL